MAKYRKKPDLGRIYIPGVGSILDDRVIEGDYDRYAALLDSVLEAPPVEDPGAAPAFADPVPPPSISDDELPGSAGGGPHPDSGEGAHGPVDPSERRPGRRRRV